MLKPENADADTTKYFRATYELKEGTDVSAQKDARDIYLKKLLDEKKLRAAGTYENNPSAGLSILSVPGFEEAEAIMKNDPYVKEFGAEYQVIQWDPKFGEFK